MNKGEPEPTIVHSDAKISPTGRGNLQALTGFIMSQLLITCEVFKISEHNLSLLHREHGEELDDA